MKPSEALSPTFIPLTTASGCALTRWASAMLTQSAGVPSTVHVGQPNPQSILVERTGRVRDLAALIQLCSVFGATTASSYPASRRPKTSSWRKRQSMPSSFVTRSFIFTTKTRRARRRKREVAGARPHEDAGRAPLAGARRREAAISGPSPARALRQRLHAHEEHVARDVEGGTVAAPIAVAARLPRDEAAQQPARRGDHEDPICGGAPDVAVAIDLQPVRIAAPAGVDERLGVVEQA